MSWGMDGNLGGGEDNGKYDLCFLLVEGLPSNPRHLLPVVELQGVLFLS